MLDKIASWDIIDFSSSSDAEIATTLKELNIPLSVEEAKKKFNSHFLIGHLH
jgi:hypothetical protein